MKKEENSKYILVNAIDRNFGQPLMFDTFEDAQKEMKKLFCEYASWNENDTQKINENIEKFVEEKNNEDSDYGTGFFEDKAYGYTENLESFDIQIFKLNKI